MTIVTRLPARSCAQDGRHALVPGIAIAGRPQERAAIMSGGPSTRMTCSEVSRAGCGTSPRRVPGTERIFGCAPSERVVAEDAAKTTLRAPDRDRDPCAVEADVRAPCIARNAQARSSINLRIKRPSASSVSAQVRTSASVQASSERLSGCAGAGRTRRTLDCVAARPDPQSSRALGSARPCAISSSMAERGVWPVARAAS